MGPCFPFERDAFAYQRRYVSGQINYSFSFFCNSNSTFLAQVPEKKKSNHGRICFNFLNHTTWVNDFVYPTSPLVLFCQHMNRSCKSNCYENTTSWKQLCKDSCKENLDAFTDHKYNYKLHIQNLPSSITFFLFRIKPEKGITKEERNERSGVRMCMYDTCFQ